MLIAFVPARLLLSPRMSCFYQALNAISLRKVPLVTRPLVLRRMSAARKKCALASPSCSDRSFRSWSLAPGFFAILLHRLNLLLNQFDHVPRDLQGFFCNVVGLAKSYWVSARQLLIGNIATRVVSAAKAERCLVSRERVSWGKVCSSVATQPLLPLHSDTVSFWLNQSVQPTSMTME